MSRVAGVFLFEAIEESSQAICQTLLEDLSANVKWHAKERCVTTSTDRKVSLGWCGYTRSQLLDSTQAVSKISLVLDGAIYNKSDFSWTKSTPELVVHLYKTFGFEEAVKRLNGDFAIALYDEQQKTLWLARDRFGIKPLYYVQTKNFISFASKPKCLSKLPGVSKTVNPYFIARFAGTHYRYIDNEPSQSPYEQVLQLESGHILRCTMGQSKTFSYWKLEEKPELEDSEDILAEQYQSLLLDAVSIRLKASHQPAFTLSGGLDSSSALACAVKLSHQKQNAISTVYTDKTYDESAEIQSMLNTKVSHWHAIQVDVPDLFKVVSQMIHAHDEPVATATWLSHYLLCEQASQLGFHSLFGGLGGDELNAGEYEYFPMYFADLMYLKKQSKLEQEIQYWIEYHDHPIFKKNKEVAQYYLSNWVDLKIPGLCLPEKKRLARYSHVLNREFFDFSKFNPVMEHRFSSYLKNRAFQDITRETAPCCLRAQDRHGVAFGLDGFLPFFDYRLVEFMFRIPGHLKIRDGVTKYLLRKAMRGILPEETRTRIKKMGWNAPAHVWFSGQTLEMMKDLVTSNQFVQRGIYNPNAVLALIEEHKEIMRLNLPQENHMMFLWQLLNLELWLRSL